jgi:RNA polymerase sigma-70 factor (ECF subfamily)
LETEKQLIGAIQSGERAAMRRLYDRYSAYAMAVALRYVPDRDKVRDVMQDSFVKILSTIDKFEYRGEGTLKAWVARVVCNKAIDHLRAQAHLAMTDNIPDRADEEQEEPNIGHLSPDALMEMIGRLPPNYRTVLNLFVFEQWSHREIANLLGIKESTSSSMFFRAKKMLAKMIKDEMGKL